MTQEEFHKVVVATSVDIQATFGGLHDLPSELADTVASIFFRKNEMGYLADDEITTYEITKRIWEHGSIERTIYSYRETVKNPMERQLMEIMASTMVDMYSYRIDNAHKKSVVWRWVERKFKKNFDVKGLARRLNVY